MATHYNHEGTKAPFRYEVMVTGELGKWYGNGVSYDTLEEAKEAGYSKFYNWTLVVNYRVLENDVVVYMLDETPA